MNKDRQKIAFGRDIYDIVLEWVYINLDPEDVFTLTRLQEWAENNGYTHEDDLEIASGVIHRE